MLFQVAGTAPTAYSAEENTAIHLTWGFFPIKLNFYMNKTYETSLCHAAPSEDILKSTGQFETRFTRGFTGLDLAVGAI